MNWPIITMSLIQEGDVVNVRQSARRIAALLGFDVQDQTRIATAVSEIARNAFGYAGGGKAEFLVEGGTTPDTLTVRVIDEGGGIADLDAVLSGRYRSPSGMGLGIVGARRLMDSFRIDSEPGRGTTVTLGKRLPAGTAPLASETLANLASALAREQARDPLSEMREQNRELLRSLDELQTRQEELARLNDELEDTNRGVVALYAELDQKAEQLRHASEMKSRFLSNMSHEFRTPLNSILAISRLLLDHVDGELTPEQERQVAFIRQSAQSLSELVNDLLDLAKVEAGKLDVYPVEFTAVELIGGLRAIFKPLHTGEAVAVLFEEPEGIPLFVTDEGKIAQILRNFISNALKFTAAGEIRVSVRYHAAVGQVIFTVRDTGVGIAPEYHERIFEEFEQVRGPLQGRLKGTGLGLPLSRKLARLLGGDIALESAPGKGSTFSLSVPPVFAPDARSGEPEPVPPERSEPQFAKCALIVDDEESSRYVIRKLISSWGFEVIEAADGNQALQYARERQPDIIFLDLHLPELSGYDVLDQLYAGPATRKTPVVVVTSATLGPTERNRLARAHAVITKDAISRDLLATTLEGLEQFRREG